MTDDQIQEALSLARTDTLVNAVLDRADNGMVILMVDADEQHTGFARWWRGDPYVCKGMAIDAACNMGERVDIPDGYEDPFASENDYSESEDEE